jgi:hypothetical protein
MEEKSNDGEWSYPLGSEHQEDLEELLSMSSQLRYIIARLPRGPITEQLLEFHQTLHQKIMKARDSYIRESRRQ